ncbi:glycosyltransferase family 2 protein [Paraburkholderia phenazinium]|jgi:glycosyltransferase involved in cell wall biosynthesis|uniref:Glycosyltransferase involved in cell wall bisynthesis n=1 Tax=Paraburkholderia phenazinium TaxID=60549 RepID=A0A1G8ESW7_9BURK|nr:glycosyltransferase family 2 protein [Paraburkholderia phenazinium]SDH72829.1 Glycosyltransferase involved in cell wall bisynthesis [Paraburkholderia phenazinium]
MNYIGREHLLDAPLLRERRSELSASAETRIASLPIAKDDSAGTPLLSLVVPFYDEEEMIGQFFDATLPVLEALENLRFEVVCVNDGSRDSTLRRLLARSDADGRIRVIDLTRNFGKEAALSAGLDEATGDILIPFDADLQDPPNVITRLVEKWREGNDVVLARRSNRDSDSYLKRRTAALFYRMHNAVCDTHIPENVGDFRLITREVADALRSLPETRRFMKGLFAWVGYRTAVVDYVREPRAAGKTKFSGWKLWNFALEGFTSFSTLPLRVWTYIGSAVAFTAFLYAAFLIARTLIQGVAVPGYASILTVVLLLGGVQLIGIGVLGEYIGRIYAESKKRPVYLVKDRYQNAGASNA